VEQAADVKLSTRRAYAEVLGLFLAFFGASATFAGFAFAGRIDPKTPEGSWAVYLPGVIDELAMAGLAVAVVLLIVRARGGSAADLGLRVRRSADGRARWWAEVRLGAWALLACVVGMVITGQFATDSIPPGPTNAANLLYDAATSINAGITEELVVLGFLVATLLVARRRTLEIFAVAVVLRVSYHLYYGPGAVGITVWAALFAWLFWRTRSLVPLIVVHVWWDLVVTFSDHVPVVGGVGALAGVGLLIVAPISWLVERASAPSHPSDSLPPPTWTAPPAWYPDPLGEAAWRWWSGTTWTSTVAGMPAIVPSFAQPER
jgi:hypothetical protein